MSDLEANRSPTPTFAPIRNLAQAKLGSLAARGMGTSDHEGVLDAFAEVFASMAAAAPASQDPTGPELDPVESDIRADNNGDRNQEDQADAADEDLPDRRGVTPLSLEEEIPRESSTGIDSNAIPTAIDRDGPSLGDQDSLDSTARSEQTPLAPGPVDTEFSQDPAKLLRDLREARKRSRDDGPRLTAQTMGDTAVNELANAGSPQSERPEFVLPEAEAGAAGIGAVCEKTDHSGDRPRRRSQGGRNEGHGPIGENAAKQTNVKSAPELFNEHSGSLPNESLSEAVAERPAAPAPEVSKAAAAAITGAPSVASATTSESNGTQNPLSSRSGAPGFTTALESTASPKSETTSDAKGTSREGVSEAVNRAKLIQRVSKAFQHLGPDGGVVRLRLAPADLGTVRIEMRIEGRKMDARVVAETEAASNALREHLPDLRARLESFGMQIERIEIETESGEGNLDGRFQGRDDGDRRSEDQGPRSRSFRPRSDDAVSRRVSSSPQTVLAETGIKLPGIGVDLRL